MGDFSQQSFPFGFMLLHTGVKMLVQPDQPFLTGGFRPVWGSELYAAARSVIGTAAKQGINPFAAIKSTLGISMACTLR
jgi:hypothetical protein